MGVLLQQHSLTHADWYTWFFITAHALTHWSNFPHSGVLFPLTPSLLSPINSAAALIQSKTLCCTVVNKFDVDRTQQFMARILIYLLSTLLTYTFCNLWIFNGFIVGLFIYPCAWNASFIIHLWHYQILIIRIRNSLIVRPLIVKIKYILLYFAKSLAIPNSSSSTFY